MSIKRYVLVEECPYGCDMQHDMEGNYVLYADHAAEVEKWKSRALTEQQQRITAESEVARLTRERDELQTLIDNREAFFAEWLSKSGFTGMSVMDVLDRAVLLEKTHKEIEAERDAAAARAERAEEALRQIEDELDCMTEVPFPDVALQQALFNLLDLTRKTGTAAQDAKPAYRALEPEPWGGPEDEEQQ